ncbi:winged helix DNA-binding domain-containing protein [Jatrophihabitans telluris]|uniref:Winged helix DNA-binding domain-containing protein n=1 Tax=Jatrophihabitans telluris TaxID=2038343 RepID=A0ABY4QT57_9ACTN|nr:crosslink repair DNA glycosylase YcaQ family protein [Jatrophihabitans telluris]UQX86762.1 winged helix DNA-binding domain-containing protein [Jatrophihabitans telluris]
MVTKAQGSAAGPTLSPAAARRIALAAQGFAAPSPAGAVTARHIRKAVDTMGLLQLDSVNVLSRSHYLPVYSRIGPYQRDVLDRLTAHTTGRITREYIEYWAHEASLIPLSTYPLLRWRMDDPQQQAWGGIARIAVERPELVDDVRRLVAESGPIRTKQTGIERSPRTPGQMWNWHKGKVALEYLFFTGQVGAARRVNFERHYDLIERILPADVLAAPTLSRPEAQRELVRIAARAYGVATEPDLGDYFRLPRTDSKLRVAELVEAGELVPVTVAGWQPPAYLWPSARRPRSVSARALLSPFDPLIWFRDRALRLFDFHYRIEIYTPAASRRYGYYVLPFLLGDTIVARVDLKADRAVGALRVQAVWAQPGVDEGYVAEHLAAELAQLAHWLGLADVVSAGIGDLAGPLSRFIR